MSAITSCLAFVTILIPLVKGFQVRTHVYERPKEVYSWKVLDVNWPSDDVRSKAINEGGYIPENNAIAGIKVWKDQMFITVPRWKAGVPVTLGVLPLTPGNQTSEPQLNAYPNWQMQTVGNCEAFQFVQSMEIDPYGRMWLLDSGRTEIMTSQPKPRCPPRLVILDLEGGGNILKIHEFPEHVTHRNVSYLNDIVLDSTDGGYAYITDNSEQNPGIIVYRLNGDQSWKIRHPTMKNDKNAGRIVSGGPTVDVTIPVDGIALSGLDEENKFVYYCPLAAYYLYALPTSVLKRNVTDVDPFVCRLGRKFSQTDGMAMTADGRLFFGLLADEAVAVWNVNTSATIVQGQRVVARDHAAMLWPDTFAISDDGYLFFITNSLQYFINDQINLQKYNFRVFKMRIGSKSYQYHRSGDLPLQLNVRKSSQ